MIRSSLEVIVINAVAATVTDSDLRGLFWLPKEASQAAFLLCLPDHVYFYFRQVRMQIRVLSY